MFERYTEKARRVIFFARYEASAFGSPLIEIEHMLLGLARECAVVRELLSHNVTESLRQKLRAEQGTRASIGTSVDLPLSPESKRMLSLAADEHELLHHRHIDCEHLFAGLLRLPPTAIHAYLKEQVGDPAELLRTVRERLPEAAAEPGAPGMPGAGLATRWIAEAMRNAPAPEFAPHYRTLSALMQGSSELLDPASEAFGEAKPDALPGTRKQALGKLIDWACQYRLWLAQALTATALQADRFPADEAVAVQRYEDMRWQFVVVSWLNANCLLLRVVGALPDAKASLPCHIGADQPVTLDQLLSRFVEMSEDLMKRILG